jgi:N-acetyl-anhydromuramyl-L-alanine amidase AmpD
VTAPTAPLVPRYVVRGTPNHSGPIGPVRGVILHGSRSGRREFSALTGDSSEGRRTLDYVNTRGTTSYNWLIDYDGAVYELAGWGLQAWHAGHVDNELHMNANWYGLAFAQVDTWEPITDAQHASAHWLLQKISSRTGVPLVRLDNVRNRSDGFGITEHRLTAQGRSGGKSDVGSGLNWPALF